MEQLGSHWTDFYEMRCLSIFSKMCQEKLKFHSNFRRIILGGEDSEVGIATRCRLEGLGFETRWGNKTFRMEQLGSHWTDFYEIRCLSIFFRKYVEKN